MRFGGGGGINAEEEVRGRLVSANGDILYEDGGFGAQPTKGCVVLG